MGSQQQNSSFLENFPSKASIATEERKKLIDYYLIGRVSEYTEFEQEPSYKKEGYTNELSSLLLSKEDKRFKKIFPPHSSNDRNDFSPSRFISKYPQDKEKNVQDKQKIIQKKRQSVGIIKKSVSLCSSSHISEPFFCQFKKGVLSQNQSELFEQKPAMIQNSTNQIKQQNEITKMKSGVPQSFFRLPGDISRIKYISERSSPSNFLKGRIDSLETLNKNSSLFQKIQEGNLFSNSCLNYLEKTHSHQEKGILKISQNYSQYKNSSQGFVKKIHLPNQFSATAFQIEDEGCQEQKIEEQSSQFENQLNMISKQRNERINNRNNLSPQLISPNTFKKRQKIDISTIGKLDYPMIIRQILPHSPSIQTECKPKKNDPKEFPIEIQIIHEKDSLPKFHKLVKKKRNSQIFLERILINDTQDKSKKQQSQPKMQACPSAKNPLPIDNKKNKRVSLKQLLFSSPKQVNSSPSKFESIQQQNKQQFMQNSDDNSDERNDDPIDISLLDSKRHSSLNFHKNRKHRGQEYNSIITPPVRNSLKNSYNFIQFDIPNTKRENQFQQSFKKYPASQRNHDIFNSTSQLLYLRKYHSPQQKQQEEDNKIRRIDDIQSIKSRDNN